MGDYYEDPDDIEEEEEEEEQEEEDEIAEYGPDEGGKRQEKEIQTKVTNPVLQLYEVIALIKTRAKDLSEGHKSLYSKEHLQKNKLYDAIKIAKYELEQYINQIKQYRKEHPEQKVINREDLEGPHVDLQIRRDLLNGDYEIWNLYEFEDFARHFPAGI